MKRCQCCKRDAKDSDVACLFCGESSWLEVESNKPLKSAKSWKSSKKRPVKKELDK